jgi:post-segregation antitoxin (ccd killing protein)
VNPGDLASLRALIVSQHTQTRANSTAQHSTTRTTILTPILAALAPILALLKQIYDAVMAVSNAAILALLNVINTKLGAQVTGGLSQFIKTIAENTYLEKALSVLTFAATVHNALMLSNNLGQTLISIVDSITGFILPKGINGEAISLSNVLSKAVHEVIETAIGAENYNTLTENWQKANRIYQATSNVFNQVTALGGLITTGLEVVGGNVGKIGNALRKGGVLLENAYGYMNPQPNLQGKFFQFLNTAGEKAAAIAAAV